MESFSKLHCRTKYVSWTIKEIYCSIEKNEIDLNPSFQRQPVWTEKRQSSLIQSIVYGYPVPSIMMVETYSNNRKRFVCLDGKQRCMSLLSFLKNKISVVIDDKLYKYSELTPDNQSEFKNIHLSVAIIENLQEEEQCKVFERINRAVPLSAGELIETYMTSPIIKVKDDIFCDDNNEYRKRLDRCLGKLTIINKDKRKTMSVNFVGVVCGLGVSVDYITTSFPRLQPILEIEEHEWNAKHHRTFIKNIDIFVSLWEKIHKSVTIPSQWTKNNRIWKIAFILGYQIYSIQKIGHMMNDKNKVLSEDLFYNVWLKFIKSAGSDANLYEKWQKSLNCKNNNIDERRLQRGWESLVEYYISGEFKIGKDNNSNDSDEDE